MTHSFKDFTTFKIGGAVGSLARPESQDEFVALITKLGKSAPFMIVGGGSNILPTDDDYAGTVVIPAFNAITWDGTSVTAEAGASWDALVAEAVAHGFGGLENLSSIPGTVGGAVVQNVGAYGAALSEHLVSVTAFDTSEGKMVTLSNPDCLFDYRTSVFKKEPGRYAIIAATFSLKQNATPNLSYRDLAARFADTPNPSLSEIRSAVIDIRKGKFPNLSEYGTAGSFFLNPVLSATEAATVAERFPGMPTFVLPEGGVKIPLAWILDHVIHVKGMREGNAFVWEEQPLVIATENGATSRDVRTLAQKIIEKVKKETGIDIAPEVSLL